MCYKSNKYKAPLIPVTITEQNSKITQKYAQKCKKYKKLKKKKMSPFFDWVQKLYIPNPSKILRRTLGFSKVAG